MEAEGILALVAPIFIAFCAYGTFGYNKIIRKWRGVVTIGKAWFSVMGMLLTVIVIARIIYAIFSGDTHAVTTTVLYAIIAAIGMYIFVKLEAQCTTTKQKIALPFACWALTLGFGFRIAAKIFMNVHMESGSSGGFPKHFSRNGKYYSLVSDNGTSALYQSQDGDQITLSRSEAESLTDVEIREDD